MPVVAMFVNGSGRNEHSIQRTFHRCFLPSFGSFGQTVSEEKNLNKSANKKQESPVVPCLLTDRDGLSKLYKGPSIDASSQVSDHLANRFRGEEF